MHQTNSDKDFWFANGIKTGIKVDSSLLKPEPKQGLASKKHEFLLSLDGILLQTSNTNLEIKANKIRDKISVGTDLNH